MKFNEAVSNPLLVGAIELLKEEPTPEHQKMVADEIVKAIYLSPVKVMSMPEPNEKGEVEFQAGEKQELQFPALTAPDGKIYFLAFTDEEEFVKWSEHEAHTKFSMSFDDYAGLLFQKDAMGNSSPVSGMVINPYGANIVIAKEMIAQYIAEKMDRKKS